MNLTDNDFADSGKTDSTKRGAVGKQAQQGLMQCRPIDLRERHLERAGPIWRSPSVVEVLQNLPFLREVPKRVVEVGHSS